MIGPSPPIRLLIPHSTNPLLLIHSRHRLPTSLSSPRRLLGRVQTGLKGGGIQYSDLTGDSSLARALESKHGHLQLREEGTVDRRLTSLNFYFLLIRLEGLLSANLYEGLPWRRNAGDTGAPDRPINDRPEGWAHAHSTNQRSLALPNTEMPLK